MPTERQTKMKLSLAAFLFLLFLVQGIAIFNIIHFVDFVLIFRSPSY